MENSISGERVFHDCISGVDKIREYVLGLLTRGISPLDIVIVDIGESDMINPNDLLNFDEFDIFGNNSLAVKIATVKDVKGLEFDYVIIAGLGRRLKPESLQLIYIAMTRAIIQCVVLYNLDKEFSILPYIAKL
jgi:hypothetical protein